MINTSGMEAANKHKPKNPYCVGCWLHRTCAVTSIIDQHHTEQRFFLLPICEGKWTMNDELPFGADYQELCVNCGRENTNLNVYGVCPACDLELMQEIAGLSQEDIDEFNKQRLSDCAEVLAEEVKDCNNE